MTRHRNVLVALALVLVSTPLLAQGAGQDTTVRANPVITAQSPVNAPAPAVQPTSAGPTKVNATVGVHKLANDALPPTSPQPSTARSSAMMVVGGAALMVGAVVGGQAGDMVMIVGGTIGLVGLWNYLNAVP